MKKKLFHILGITCVSISLCFVAGFTVPNPEQDLSSNGDDFEVGAILPDDHVFTTMDIDGNVVEMNITELEEKTKSENTKQFSLFARTMAITTTVAPTYGVVNFKTKASANTNTKYTIDGTSIEGYTNGYYGADAAYLGEANGKVKFMQAGVIGWVNASEVSVLNYDNSSQVKSVNFYKVVSGRIIHYGTNDISKSNYFMTTDIGPKQAYMKEGDIFYSYDGHHFYGSYHAMINDYKAGTRANSVNSKAGYGPYYNYYQFLSHRSKTKITEAQINSFVASKSSAQSKMRNQGNSFISNQNIYGTNALLMVGVAANESAWGDSAIAQSKNNLFGHAAYDADPNGANGYSSPAFSIYYHSKVFVSEGYLDPKDYSGRYNGGHLGDKSSGMNVKYASDPYWGEKAAAVAWSIDKNYASTKDSGSYSFGVKVNNVSVNLRQNANTTSPIVYTTGTVPHFPFVVMEKVTGASVGGSTTWYKIQSDSTLNADRSAITQDNGKYDFSKYYLYIHQSTFDVLVSGSGSSGGETEPPVTPPTAYKKGDVNGDGSITLVDMAMIKSSLLGHIKLNHNQKQGGDVNGDGSVTLVDMAMIKSYLLGYIKL